MRKKLLTALSIALISFNIYGQIVNIRDANFKAYLVGNSSINTNGDSEIQMSEANAFSGAMNCSSRSIADLTGIEAFVNLTKLIGNYNSLTSLDLSQNIHLTHVEVTNNDIRTIDVSQCTALTFLKFQGNEVSTIDLTQNTILEELYCNYNNLSTIDLSKNTALTFLAFNGNLFRSIDLSKNTAIETLFSGENPNLTSLDLSNNTSLKAVIGNFVDPGILSSITLGQNPNFISIDCENCGLNSLDVSQTPNITYMGLAGNNLTTIDLSSNTALTNIILQGNDITALDLSNNANLTSINCSANNLSSLNLKNISTSAGLYVIENPNLTCIEVDDVAAAETAWTYIDAIASFSLSCEPTVNIPDANFKAYLVGNTSINSNGDAEIQASEASNFTGAINCSELGITDLTGIEEFTSITELDCSENGLTTLDLTQNTALSFLNFEYNNISAIDLSQNTALTVLRCEDTNLNTLDISKNSLLTILICKDNNLTSLDVSNNSLLFHLDCVDNNINSLDISHNTSLEEFYCTKNTPLTELNMKNISPSVLTDFYATSNPNLTCIEVDDVAAAEASWTNIDETTSFSLDCQVLVTSIDAYGQGGISEITTDQGTLQMEATVYPENADDVTYAWSVINGTGEAAIDDHGLLTAITNGTVTVAATANDDSGVSGETIITISNQVILSSEKANNSQNLEFYPNPVTSQLFINLKETINSLVVIDLSGKKVVNIKASEHIIDMTDLDKGVYTLIIQTDSGVIFKKFFKE